MTVLEAIQRSTDFLAKKGVESPRLQTELLLAHVLGLPRLKLYLNFERQLAENELAILREFVQRRGRREPLQHVIGTAPFCGFDLKVNRHVLVPRPETELLAERAWRFLEARAAASVTALDFGTGSGCLALALALHCPRARVHALDVSADALAVARENAVLHGVTARVQFHAGDGFAALPPDARFDLIVANPPYIATAEIETLAPEVRDHDPRLALDGGADGLGFFRRLAAGAARHLVSDGRLMLEFGDGQEGPIRQVFAGHMWIVESVEADYSQRPRVLTACLGPA